MSWEISAESTDTIMKQSNIICALSYMELNKTFYINDSFNLHIDQWIEQINNSNIDYVVINGSDYAPPLDFDGLNYNQRINKKIIYLNNKFTHNNHYPFWLVNSITWAKQDTVDITAKKPYNIVCLNSKIRYTRLYVLYKLLKKSYIDTIKIAGGIESIDQIFHEDDDRLGDQQLLFEEHHIAAKELISKFCDISGYCDFATEEDKVKSIAQNMDTAYLQVVNESRPELSAFVSEKIFKPLRAGQLFLVHGSPGTINHLRQLGFDVFDDHIDHNRYDNEPNWQKRADLMLAVLDDIHNNIENIYYATTERRQYNIDLFKKSELMDHVVAGIQRQL